MGSRLSHASAQSNTKAARTDAQTRQTKHTACHQQDASQNTRLCKTINVARSWSGNTHTSTSMKTHAQTQVVWQDAQTHQHYRQSTKNTIKGICITKRIGFARGSMSRGTCLAAGTRSQTCRHMHKHKWSGKTHRLTSGRDTSHKKHSRQDAPKTQMVWQDAQKQEAVVCPDAHTHRHEHIRPHGKHKRSDMNHKHDSQSPQIHRKSNAPPLRRGNGLARSTDSRGTCPPRRIRTYYVG